MPIILAFGKMRQEDSKFEASLRYIMRYNLPSPSKKVGDWRCCVLTIPAI
jgi:hypothetical protein